MSTIRDQTVSDATVRPRKGELLELRVEHLAHGGAGVARRDGYVVFVDGGLPGDLVKAEVTRSKRDYAQARLRELLEPGGDRVAWRCDHEGGVCPGSPWQPLRYDRQLEHKQQQVTEALRRLGGFRDFEAEEIIPAGSVWRYRNKLEYSFGSRHGESSTNPIADAGTASSDLVLGFHPRGEWERVDDARDCMLASERNNAVRNFVRDWCRAEGLAPYDRRAGGGLLRNLVVREGWRTGDLQIRLVTTEEAFDELSLAEALATRFPGVSLLRTRTDALAEVSRGETVQLLGSDRLEEEIGALCFRISPEAFFQTNTEMAERLYELAVEYSGLSGRERVFDIYCGIGTLSLSLALRAGEVWGIEIDERAVADAIDNARLNEIDNVHFFAGDARLAIRPLSERAPRPDVVVIDPPRAGLSKKVVRRVLETNPRRIVYVSCNPTTLAPNARQIVDGGYRLVKVRPVDMFPHTPHIESVALLERTDA
jgi:23S rRNA (uracil1939-C5)-methyltransferase